MKLCTFKNSKTLLYQIYYTMYGIICKTMCALCVSSMYESVYYATIHINRKQKMIPTILSIITIDYQLSTCINFSEQFIAVNSM